MTGEERGSWEKRISEEERDFTDEYSDIISDWLDSSVDSIEAQTSGSTGTPKSILLPKHLVRQSAWRTIRYFGIDRSWILGACISAKYIGGKMMAVRSLEIGCKFVSEPPSNRPQLRLIRESQRKVLMSVVPSQMWHILNLRLSEAEKKRIHFLIGGSAIPQVLRDAIADNGLQAWESYGMTETCSHIALRKVSKEMIPFSPLPGIEVESSEKDTLIIRNAGDGEIMTNDLVEIDSNGNFQILGRLDNVIISGGLKVIPEQTEAKIKSILASSTWADGISELMIASQPDEKWGQVPVLLLEIPKQEELFSATADEILLFLSKYKPDFLLPQEFPRKIIISESIPRTPGGKLKRKI
ncbi:MAG: AMP-binding protein [Muribaculaceae bacterium]|nr:AMP-binding protein [Muribaculaceae bacterium]